MTEAHCIRNTRVMAARRFEFAQATFGGLPFPGLAPVPFGRSYANRTAPRKRANVKVANGGVFTFKASGFEIGGLSMTPMEPKPTGAPPDARPVEFGSQVSVRMFKFEVKAVRVSRGWGTVTAVHVDFTVPDRDTGLPINLTYNHAILPSVEKHYMAEMVSTAIAKAFEHEVREMVYLGAKRFIEPHPEAVAAE